MTPTASHIFVGGRDRGFAWLQLLAQRRQLPSVVYCLREDDHEMEKYAPAIAGFCEQHGIPCRLRRKLEAADEAEIADLKPDLLVVMGWRTMISDRVISAPRHGAVGVHESLLPAYRGFAPVNWVVINGETRTGVSLFYMTSTGVDNGDIIDQAVVPIGELDTAGQVYARTSQASVRLLDERLNELLTGTAPRRAQDEAKATYTCARIPDDGLIDWRSDTQTIHNLVRGLAHPYPGAFSWYGGKRCRIWSGRPVESPRMYVGRIPGRIVGIASGRGVEVLTGDGMYLIQSASEDGKPPAAAESLFRSVKAGFDQGGSTPRMKT
ncbi:MAG: methionyl-tRNA formyltransferase [Gemmataceae bacterium]|nr:methionyl-tRNA formyltransferase [Gemmataceae bacterium]